jgi:chitinase
LAQGKLDDTEGGQWWWDKTNKIFWSWDTPDIINKKFSTIIDTHKLGGIMAWSMGLDSHDYSHLKAIQSGYQKYLAN